MKILIYILCIPIKLVATLMLFPLMACAVAMSYSLDGDNDVDIAKEMLVEVWTGRNP